MAYKVWYSIDTLKVVDVAGRLNLKYRQPKDLCEGTATTQA